MFLIQNGVHITANNYVEHTDQYEFTGKYTLHIRDTDNADSGLYSCHLNNQSYSWDLVVYGEYCYGTSTLCDQK